MIQPRTVVSGRTTSPRAGPDVGTRIRALAAGALALALVACGESGPSVQITSPADGATLPAGAVLVTLEVSGLTIAPAGTMDPGTGHHHLIVDSTFPTLGAPIPSVPGIHFHMGAGQTELELTGLGSGEHTIIAVVGDGVHVPLNPPVADTITITIE